MKARIKATGEVVEVVASLGLGYYTYGIDGKQYLSSDIEFLKDDSEADNKLRLQTSSLFLIKLKYCCKYD